MRPDGGPSIFGLAPQSGPRFARDALGPLLIFYASWKLVGLAAGIAAATVFAAGGYVWEFRYRVSHRGRHHGVVDVVRRPEPPLAPGGPGR
jgi:hypothetical protein